jgi:hypothetical protein
MRSGWHIEFDAHLATGRVRAERAEAMRRMAVAMAPWARAFRQLGVNATQAAQQITGAFARLRATQIGAEEQAKHLRELAKSRRRLP